VMEYLEKGDLLNYLRTSAREEANFDKLLLICEDVILYLFFD